MMWPQTILNGKLDQFMLIFKKVFIENNFVYIFYTSYRTDTTRNIEDQHFLEPENAALWRYFDNHLEERNLIQIIKSTNQYHYVDVPREINPSFLALKLDQQDVDL